MGGRYKERHIYSPRSQKNGPAPLGATSNRGTVWKTDILWHDEPIQPTRTFAMLCRSYGAAPGFGYGSYKDFAPTQLCPSRDMLAANMVGAP